MRPADRGSRSPRRWTSARGSTPARTPTSGRRKSSNTSRARSRKPPRMVLNSTKKRAMSSRNCRADEARQPAQHERRAHADRLEREVPGRQVGLDQPLDRRRVDGRRSRAPARRGSRARSPSAACRGRSGRSAPRSRSRRAWPSPRTRASRRAGTRSAGRCGCRRCARALAGSRRVALDDLVEGALLVEHHRVQRAGRPCAPPSADLSRRHRLLVVAQRVEAERVGEPLGRVDGEHQRPPSGARAGERRARRPWWSCRRRPSRRRPGSAARRRGEAEAHGRAESNEVARKSQRS